MEGDGAERYLAEEIFAAAIAMTLAGSVRDSEPAFVEPCPGHGIQVSETVLLRDSLSDFNDACEDLPVTLQITAN
jgi:hypothetical protein